MDKYYIYLESNPNSFTCMYLYFYRYQRWDKLAEFIENILDILVTRNCNYYSEQIGNKIYNIICFIQDSPYFRIDFD